MRTVPTVFCIVFLGIVASLHAAEAPPLKMVYFTPSDCKPAEDRQERLGRVMTCVQEFYKKGMTENGYGPKTFGLEWDSPKKLKLYMVRVKKTSGGIRPQRRRNRSG